MARVLELSDVSVVRGGTTILDRVSWVVNDDERWVILGPNGAGKTTTLEIIEGLREADAGTATLLGQPPWPRNPDLLPRMGVQLQASAFFESLTALEQLQTFADLYGVGTARVNEMLEVVGLTDSAKVRTEKLSGGQAQRLSIACALINDPEIVFLDEPTAALDPQARRNLWTVLQAINDRVFGGALPMPAASGSSRYTETVALAHDAIGLALSQLTAQQSVLLREATRSLAQAPAERQAAYKRARRELDGLIVLPDVTVAALEDKIAPMLDPSSRPTDSHHG